MIRKPHFAGSFYPGNKIELEKIVNDLLSRNRSQNKFQNVIGIVSPHAGYVYSGATASYGFNAASGNEYETIIVISPSHEEYFQGISIYEGDAYETPLGVIEIDKEIRKLLTESDANIFEGIKGHRDEHALEVQLPFLQSTFKNFKLVPIVMGDQSKENVDLLANALSQILNEKILIVASSDLSHQHTKDEANQLDSRVEERINNFDPDGLLEDLSNGRSEACGGGPIAAMMKAASLKNFNKAQVLKRSDSGDVNGDFSYVVGYLSAVVHA